MKFWNKLQHNHKLLLMKKNIKLSYLLLAIIIALSACKSKKKTDREALKIDQGFREYVTAFTSGIVSSKDVIRVKLTSQYKQVIEPGTAIDAKVFTFEPGIKGIAVWADAQTIEFRPENALKSGVKYKGSFLLGSIIEVKDKFKSFPLQFQVVKQSFQIRDGDLKPYDAQNLKVYKYEGKLITADYIENSKIEELLKAEQDANTLPIMWKHDAENKSHSFQIDSIKRKESDDMFSIAWDGAKYGIDVKGSNEIEIPGISNFKLINMQVFHQPNQHVLLTFSDPLDKSQNLRGLIQIKNTKNLSFKIDGNQVKVFLKTRIAGEREIRVDKAIKNVLGYRLKSRESRELTFEATKPQVRLIGKGVIIPNSNGLMFPFESVNLNAVDVSIIKIYEDNVAQFLQVNQLDGNRDLKRVGRLIMKKKIELITENLIDYGKWNAFSIDLAELIENEPGAIYKVELSFKKSYSMYPCTDNGLEEEALEENWDDSYEDEQSYWDAADDYYYYGDNYYYNWRDRDNPCKKAYYANKKVSRNVLASDLGLIAKVGKNNELKVIVSDILTTKPVAGVEIEILNYQQQIIGNTKTNSEGIATVPFEMKPFLLVAKSNSQRGYLKLNDGTSLSLSKFDVGGTEVQKGIKGFIYGERGVWRPGDTLFLSYILEDKDNLLPPEHPVTFELLNPDGKIMQRIIKSSGENGFYNFTTKTKPDDPTGNWLARVKVGGATFVKYIKVETVKPNRLKINFDFGVERLTPKDENLTAKIEVKWLHGAIAKNLETKIDVTLTAIKTVFNSYADYIFDDPSLEFYPIEKSIFDGSINENGEAKIKPYLKINDKAPGMLQASFFTKVFEEGGNFSVDQYTIPYAPYKTFVGIKTPKGDKARGMLLTDVKHKIDVVTVDADGNKVSQSGLVGKLYKVNWRWWWQSGEDNLASYIGRNHVSPISTEKFSTVDGFGSFEIEIKYPDWGRYLLKVESPNGHSTGKTVYIDWPGWAGRAQSENPGGAAMLTFAADKNNYMVGENAEVVFPSSEGGRALVSIEKGAKVLETYWVETQKEQTKFQFGITEQMAPNIYVNITLLQPHAQTVNDLPIRLYGVIPLMVEDPNTKLEPIIEMADELKPESEVNITVKEKQGKPMTFTVAVVDEGLLDLTRFKTPDPWNTFYAREALSVKTWDMYDLVMGAYGGKIEQVFAIGGDDEMMGKKNQKAKRFVPVVKYFGPYTIGKNGEQNISFEMPRYIGSVKTMVVAGNKNAYGSAEKATPVKNPLMMLATLPRVISPGEKVKLPVTVFALDEKIRNVKVEIKTNDFLIVQGNNSQVLTFDKPGEFDFQFDIDVAKKLGVGKVELIAKSGKEEATYEIEIDVRAPNPKKIKTYSALVQANDKVEYNFDIFGIPGTNAANIEVSGMPPINIDSRLRYLIRYPYGCIEQTTSSVFPQLYLAEVTDLDKDMKKRIKSNIESGLDRLKSFQISNGGFAYWPGNNTANEWGSNYAGHFILEAERSGYTLPVGMKENWLNYQRDQVNNWSPGSNIYKYVDFTQAYRLYTLSLAGEPDLGAMNRLKEYEKMSVQTRYYLSLAYALSGNDAAAKDLILNIDRDVDDYTELSYTYGSGDRDRAIILEALLELNLFDEAMPIIKTISESLNSKKWMSTQTTAFCLRAMSKTASVFKKSLEEFNYSIKLNNEKALAVMSTNLINQHPLSLNQSDTSGTIVIKNESGVPFYINFSTEGIPLTDENDKIEKNLKLSIVYKDLDNNVINEAKIEQGTDFKAEIKVTHTGLLDNYKEMALSAMFPSGWEIHNTRLYGGGETHVIDVPTYQDIRDDRVNTFFDIKKGQTKTFVIMLNASYLGEYSLPAIQCGAMYSNDIQARIPGKTVKVVKPGK